MARLVDGGLDLFRAGPGKVVCERHGLRSAGDGQAAARAAHAVGVT